MPPAGYPAPQYLQSDRVRHLEPLLLVSPLDHLQLPAAFAPRPIDQPLLLIDPIDPDHLQSGTAILGPGQRGLGPMVVLDIRRGHHDGNQ